MQHIVTILIAILIFFIIVVIHEFGHFIAAKLNRIQVNQFAVGMGPKLLHFQKGRQNTLSAFFLLADFVPWRAKISPATIRTHLKKSRCGGA